MFLPPDQPSAGGPRALTPGLVCLAACSTLSQRPPGAQAPAPASWMTLQPPRLRTQCFTHHLPEKLSLASLHGLLLRKSALRHRV